MKPFDLQVNGYAGVDFNGDDLDGEALRGACEALAEDGVGGVLATVITSELGAMCGRLARIAALREEDDLVREMIVGMHVEGPFLNEGRGYAGAHPAAAMREADIDSAERLMEACGGLMRVMTLAPERDEHFAVTRFLREKGVCVSAGHCDPSLDQLKGAIDAGLSMITHLGNGCPMEMHRHDNVIQRVLSLPDAIWICFIPDGVHVPFFALRNYLQLAGLERAILVTDAISAARLGAGRYAIGDQEVTVDASGTAWSASGENFAGSTVTMPQVRRNVLAELGMSEDDFTRMTAVNPRQAIGEK
jgi:N-acetylglucosamine-6-phosphate deacetylase